MVNTNAKNLLSCPAVMKASSNTHLIPQFLVELMESDTWKIANIPVWFVMLTHAAFSDAGFTLFNKSRMMLPKVGSVSQGSYLRLLYTISDLVDQDQETDEKVVILVFFVFNNLLEVYGFMGGVDTPHFHELFYLTKIGTLCGLDLNYMSIPEQEGLMKMFHRVKDEFSLPLMIDLLQNNSLPLPPCFMLLPIDLKHKIMELLPGPDAVHVGSTCKEMQNLSLDENLWRQKFEREFSSCLLNKVMLEGTWREKYKKAYNVKKSLTFNFARPPWSLTSYSTGSLFASPCHDHSWWSPWRYGEDQNEYHDLSWWTYKEDLYGVGSPSHDHSWWRHGEDQDEYSQIFLTGN